MAPTYLRRRGPEPLGHGAGEEVLVGEHHELVGLRGGGRQGLVRMRSRRRISHFNVPRLFLFLFLVAVAFRPGSANILQEGA